MWANISSLENRREVIFTHESMKRGVQINSPTSRCSLKNFRIFNQKVDVKNLQSYKKLENIEDAKIESAPLIEMIEKKESNIKYLKL